MSQSLLQLSERGLTKCRLFEHLTNRLATWRKVSTIPASTDPSLDELLKFTDSDKEKEEEKIVRRVTFKLQNTTVNVQKKALYRTI